MTSEFFGNLFLELPSTCFYLCHLPFIFWLCHLHSHKFLFWQYIHACPHFCSTVLSPDDLRRLNADLHAADRISRQGHVTIVCAHLSPWRGCQPALLASALQRGPLPSQKPVDSVPNVVLCLYMTKEIDKISPVPWNQVVRTVRQSLPSHCIGWWPLGPLKTAWI